MTSAQKAWVLQTAGFAYNARHIFPTMAACEAALESDYGASQLSRIANNLFGMKQHLHPVCGTLSLPTKEFLDGEWVPTTADWVEYPSLVACFQDRMDTLLRLRTAYPHYANALAASTAQDYAREVSQSWSTDPQRAQKCIDIFNAIFPNVQVMSVDQSTQEE